MSHQMLHIMLNPNCPSAIWPYASCSGFRCRNHDATVQGTVSAAAMVAIAAVEAAEQPLPQVICNLASKPAARGRRV